MCSLKRIQTHLELLIISVFIWTMVSGTWIPEVTEADLPSVLKDNSCVFLYVSNDNCERCRRLYYTFVATAQTFRNKKDIYFGKTSDTMLINTFAVTSFPGVVYYEYGSNVPKVYLDDITPGALTKVACDAMKIDYRKLDRQYAIALTEENFDAIMNTDIQNVLVMLHEADDEDEIDMYDEIGQTFENEPEIIIARINVDFERKLRRKYSAIEYPSFYWYQKGVDKKKQRYGGELDVRQMISFINKEVGLFRTKGGKLSPYAGLIKQLDKVIHKHGKDLHEIRNFDEIRKDLKAAEYTLEAGTDQELVDFYFYLLAEIEEDRSIEALDENRSRLFRQMSSAGPLRFDRLVMKKNIINKVIDTIGQHLLMELSDEVEAFTKMDENYNLDGTMHDIEFHEEL